LIRCEDLVELSQMPVPLAPVWLRELATEPGSGARIRSRRS